jgi:hypothetical protein
VLVLPCNRVTGLPRHSLTVRSLLKTLSVPQDNRHLDQEMKCMNVEDFFFIKSAVQHPVFASSAVVKSYIKSLCSGYKK